MDTIVSKSNEKVKYLKSLNDKKFRQKYNAFYLEGIKVVHEILNNKAINILFIAYSEDILLNLNGGKELIDEISSLNLKDKLILLSKSVFEYIVDTTSPQGILVVIEKPKYDIEELLNKNNGDYLVLDKVQDLGNIGTIIRSAVAFGINTMFLIEGTADVYSPKVLRSTMGAITKVNVIYVNMLEIKKIFDNLKAKDYKVIGTSLKSSESMEKVNFDTKNVFIVGNEANGVSDEMLSLCDSIIKIPMMQTTESLNVSVATSIIMYKNYIDKNNKNVKVKIKLKLNKK